MIGRPSNSNASSSTIGQENKAPGTHSPPRGRGHRQLSLEDTNSTSAPLSYGQSPQGFYHTNPQPRVPSSIVLLTPSPRSSPQNRANSLPTYAPSQGQNYSSQAMMDGNDEEPLEISNSMKRRLHQEFNYHPSYPLSSQSVNSLQVSWIATPVSYREGNSLWLTF